MAAEAFYPGVYIEEFAPGAPIQGVGTSTAAFIGVAERGLLNEPTKITSWDNFRTAFGPLPVLGSYLWYAVRGFFQNGGQTCYIVRASNGSYQRMTLNDRTAAPGRPVVALRARQPGAQGITVTVADAPVLSNVPVYRPSGALNGPAQANDLQVTLDADGGVVAANVANRFKAGDEVSFSVGADRRVIASVTGAIVRFTQKLNTPLPSGTTMRLADTAVGAQTIRLRPAGTGPLASGQLVQGTILTVQQGASDTQIVESVIGEVLTEGVQGGQAPVTYRVTFRSGLKIALNLDPAAATPPQATSRELKMDVTVNLDTVTYDGLSMDPSHPRYLIDIVNGAATGPLTAALIDPPPANDVATSLPQGGAQPTSPAAPGTAENLSTMTAANFIEAIDTLKAINDVNFIAVPDRPTAPGELLASVQQALITHCELMADRFAVLDNDPRLPLFGNSNSLEQQRRGLDSSRGYAAIYAPWLRVIPSTGGPPILVPPSGHVCGIFARSDAARGVHKAPANEIVNGALGVATRISLIEQGQLNRLGINIVQVFEEGARPILWGARTTATDTNWQYVNIRRLFLFLEESIERGIRWAVFEPNNQTLWKKLTRTITAFLTQEWRDGALFGARPEDAFRVRIDEGINPDSERALGRLYIEIAVRPSYPAEFIIVRIGIWQGGSEVSEQ